MLETRQPDTATDDDLEQQVIGVIRGVKEILPSTLTATTLLVDLGVDSLDALNIMFAIEEHFHIAITDERARAIRTFGDVLDTVRALTAAPL